MRMAAATAQRDRPGRLAQWRDGAEARSPAARAASSAASRSAPRALFALVALLTYHPSDPSLNTDAAGPVRNWMGGPGAWTSDLLLTLLGPPVGLLLPVILVIGLRLARGAEPGRWLRALIVTFARHRPDRRRGRACSPAARSTGCRPAGAARSASRWPA